MLYPFESLPRRTALPSAVFYPKWGSLKRRWAAFALALALATAGTSGAEAASSCRLPGGRTVAKGRVALLIAVPTPSGSALYACIRRSGRKVALDVRFTDARVAGRWVAWQQARRRDGGWRIVVHDLRTGKERLVDGHVAEHSLDLTTRGSIVWAQALDESERTPLYANEVDDGGRLLDGGEVDASSVRLAGRRVSWLSAGVRRSALVR
jgi:hypothetical protein